jgi:hypothetical protein
MDIAELIANAQDLYRELKSRIQNSKLKKMRTI